MARISIKSRLLFLFITVISLNGCKEKTSALEDAASSGNLEVVKSLPSESSENKKLALLTAAKNGRFEIVRFYIESGLAASGHVLWHAVMGKNSGTINYLLDKGANVNEEVDQDGTNVFMEGIRTGDVEVIKLLLKGKPNLGAKLENGTTVLDIVQQSKNDEIIALVNAYKKTVK